MPQRIGCYHAHYSNIEYIQKALEGYDAELIHFVDPGLDRRKTEAGFTAEQGQRKIADTLSWIASCQVDAILITCTYFTANITGELERSLPVPLVKIDDPMLALICSGSQPQLLVFTNPATVDGTMNRVREYALNAGKAVQLHQHLLDHTFQLMMAGKKEAYIERVTKGLEQAAAQYPDHQIWAAQLSMAPAAELASAGGAKIRNPLEALTAEMVKLLKLERLQS